MSRRAATPTSALAMEALLDTAAMTRRVRPVIGRRAVVSEAKVLDGTGGQRAVIRYRLSASAISDLYGKAYVDETRALDAYNLMCHVKDAASESAAVCVPKPIGIVHDLALVLYEPVQGRALEHAAGGAAMIAGIEGAAGWLAGFHTLRLHFERELDLVHEAHNAAGWTELVAERQPESAALARRLADVLVQTVPECDRVVPIHKDFHYQHVIVGDRLGVIDLDEARMGDAAFDLGHFTANLDLLASRLRVTAAQRDVWRRTFIDAYLDKTRCSSPATMKWFEAYACAKIARQLATGRGPRPRPVGVVQRREVGEVIRRGVACLA